MCLCRSFVGIFFWRCSKSPLHQWPSVLPLYPEKMTLVFMGDLVLSKSPSRLHFQLTEGLFLMVCISFLAGKQPSILAGIDPAVVESALALSYRWWRPPITTSLEATCKAPSFPFPFINPCSAWVTVIVFTFSTVAKQACHWANEGGPRLSCRKGYVVCRQHDAEQTGPRLHFPSDERRIWGFTTALK